MDGKTAQGLKSGLFQLWEKLKTVGPWVILTAAGLAGLGLLIVILLYLIEPTAPAENITFSNISDSQVTVSWTTNKPTRGAVLVSEDGRFPLKDLFSSKLQRDDGEKHLPRQKFYRTHQITIVHLSASRGYYFRIYQGFRKAYEGQIFTGPVLSFINNPNPVYGRILGAKRQPQPGVLVFLTVTGARGKSAVLSTMTNKEGRWSLDLGNLRSSDLKEAYRLAQKDLETVVLSDGLKKASAKAIAGHDKPWPDLVLK